MPLMQMHARNVQVPHRQICPDQFAADVDPTFSPDGTRIAFATSRDGNYEIYIMNPDGSEQTRVTTNTASDLELSWQPTVVGLPKTGDINGNGQVTLVDAIYLAKHVGGFSGYETIYADGDINANGQVTLVDAIYLAKHVGGFIGYEKLY